MNLKILTNPCKKCLVTPICEEKCTDLQNHKKVIEIIDCCLLAMLASEIYLICLFHIAKFFEVSIGIIFLAQIGILFTACVCSLILDTDDYKEDKYFIEIVIMCVLFIFGAPPMVLYFFLYAGYKKYQKFKKWYGM